MSSINRQIPETNDSRLKALHLATNKLDSIPPGTNPLTVATTARLNVTTGDFDTKVNTISIAKSNYNTGTPGKETGRLTLRMFISQFIQVFNFGVERGKYPAGNRSFYNLPIENGNVPELVKDSDLLMWGIRMVTGDANRIAAGGLPMTNPDATEVQAAFMAFHTPFTNQSNLKDALDNAQEALAGILVEADKVIKKVWDELETHYNEETAESRRANLIEWGVVYVTVGGMKTMSGTIIYNGAAGAGLAVRFESGKKQGIANAAGEYTITTTLMNEQKVVVEKLDDDGNVIKEWEFEVTLSENDDKTANFVVND